MLGIPTVDRFVALSLVIYISVSVNKIRLSVCRILVNSDKLLILEDSHSLLVGFSEVAAYNKRRAHHCPKSKVCFVFLSRTALEPDMALTLHSDNEHIHIVKAAAAVVLRNLVLRKCKLLDRLPCIKNVACRTPCVCSGFLDPRLCVFTTPRTCSEKNVPAAIGKSETHSLIEHMTVGRERMITIVIFEVIDSPFGKAFRINEFMIKASGISGAGHRSGTGIHAELQSL